VTSADVYCATNCVPMVLRSYFSNTLLDWNHVAHSESVDVRVTEQHCFELAE
jgi:hypothetical protein